MASYTNQSTDSLLPGEPWTSAKALAAFENPTAIAEGASGAPTMQVAWHLLEAVQLSALDTTLSFSTDISAYRAIRLVGGLDQQSGGTGLYTVDILISGTWRTAVTTSGSLNNAIIDVTIDRTDADDLKTVTAIIGETNSISDYSQRTATTYMSIVENIGAATSVRITSAANMDTTTEVNLYGIKRTAT